MIRLQADIHWRTDGANGVRLDSRLLDLLRSLERHPTLRAAAAECGLSYRAAWGQLLDASALVGTPLVELQRGRGARLTALGTDLLRNDARMRKALEPLNERFGLAAKAATRGSTPLRLAASHDPLLAEFCERIVAPQGIIGETSYRGSEESLALYARGFADIAGFHIEEGSGASSLRRFLKPRRDQLVRFAGREQGLIVARGNPKKLSSLADVARRHARFVNRQKGSGTRMLVDRLLRDGGIAAEEVRGYGTEEYTHVAVAATVAAGRADAAFGVRAAAAQLGLGFVPAVRERYWLAIGVGTCRSSIGRRLLEALGGKSLGRLARGMPGYHLAGAGEIVSADDVFA
jgi:molybdate transport repressor ModE-like protein